ncbi:hypothetical protein D3C84_678560 [compost metagenome]
MERQRHSSACGCFHCGGREVRLDPQTDAFGDSASGGGLQHLPMGLPGLLHYGQSLRPGYSGPELPGLCGQRAGNLQHACVRHGL